MEQKGDPMQVDNVSQKNETENQALAQQQKVRLWIGGYVAQLVKGCGRNNCTNVYCASSPNATKYATTSDAAAQAIQLVRSFGKKYLHEDLENANQDPLMQPLSLHEVKSITQEAKVNNSPSNVVKRIGAVFGTSAILNISFLKENADLKQPDLGVDVPALREAYSILLNQEAGAIKSSLISALERLVSAIKFQVSTFNEPKYLRLIIIFLEFPQMWETEYAKTLLSPFCSIVASLPSVAQDIVQNYIASQGRDFFKKLIGNLQNSITLRFFLPPFVTSVHTDEIVINLCKFLDFLNTTNDKRNQIVDYADFYNEQICDAIFEDLRTEFINWKHQKGFAFAKLPCILKPDLKSKLLQVESTIAQRERREDAIRQLFFGGGFGSMVLVLKIRRENLIPDSLSEVSRYPSEDLKKELKVHFVGEEAIDEGGVQKEWFQLIIREIFDPKYGMFNLNKETHTYWFNNLSTDFLEFELIGKLLGLAIYNSVILDVHFPRVVYKKLMGIKCTLEDLKQTNPSLAIGLEKLLKFEGDVEGTYDQNFQITYEYFGDIRTYDLKEGGAQISLTNANRQEYVDLYLKYLLEDSVKKQFDAFQRGFKMVCDSAAFKLFRHEELELLICGSPVLDFEALEKNTKYDNGYTKDHVTIKNFWEVVHSMQLEQKKKLLFFATGSDRSPIGGLGNLQFVIVRHGEDSDRLPSAHTCFNVMLLPEYSTKEKLRERLLTAIGNAEGFGML